MIELIGCILLAIIGILLICAMIDELRTNYRMRKDIERKMEINNDDDLNIEYICNKTLLDKNDELVPIILDIINESYKAGLCQAEFDNAMELIEENNELKKRLEEYKKKLMIATRMEIKQIDETTFLGIDYFQDKCINYENQQKEFINYLEEKIKYFKDLEQFAIKIFNNKAVINLDLIKRNIEEDNLLICNFEEILQKYKEIIER